MCSITEIKNAIPMLDEIPIGILITDNMGTIQFSNAHFELITGYGSDEIKGMTPSILKSGKHSELFYKNLWDTILSGEIFEGEIKNKKKDGSIYWQKVAIQPFRNKEGKIENFIAYINDITAIRHDLLMYEAMIKTSYDSHIIWDKDRRCLYVYPSDETSYPEFYKQLVGKTLDETIDIMHELVNSGMSEEEIKGDMVIQYNKLFNAIDENPLKTYHTIVRACLSKKNTIVLEIVMQKFNSDKYYSVIRNITDFSRSREALINMETALKSFAKIQNEKREFIYGK